MDRTTLFMLYGAIGVVLVLGTVSYLNMTAQDNEIVASCNDTTLNMQCSEHKPMMCVNGELVENAQVCGCPAGYEEKDGTCKMIETCNDGTLVGQCSASKPLYCENGELVQKASMCGCADGYLINDNVCVLTNNTVSLTRVFPYTLRGEKGRIDMPVYSELKVYLANISRKFACIDGKCPTYAEMEMMIINESKEKTELDRLVSEIEGKSSNKDDQARIAISLVQTIPYDTYAAVNNDIKGRYPYEVVYDRKGVCGEKSRLLAYILKELGFGVALFSFEPENHMAVGIECPMEYSYKGTGYCFVETTTPSIITDSSGTYGIRGGSLVSAPNVIVIGEGMSFDSVSQEYSDAKEYAGIFNTAESNGSNVVDNLTYMKYRGLLDKYGIQTQP